MAILQNNFRSSGKPYIDNDGAVSVTGNSKIALKVKQTTIPIKFGSVSAFYCTSMGLTSLINSPDTCRSFHCNNNLLTSLEFCPKTVTGEFNCRNNPITTLQFLPNFADYFVISWNENLPLLKLLHANMNSFRVYDGSETHPITKILREYQGKTPMRPTIIQCQKALIDAGYAGNATL